MDRPSVECKEHKDDELKMLTTRQLIEMKWNIAEVENWYDKWKIECKLRERSPIITVKEYSADDILRSSVEYRAFEITKWLYETLYGGNRYGSCKYPHSKEMDIISFCSSIVDNAASPFSEAQKLLQFFLVRCKHWKSQQPEIIRILFKHQQFQLLKNNLGHIDFKHLYPWLCAQNSVEVIKFFASHNQNQFKNAQMWRECIDSAWESQLNGTKTSETIAYVLGQVGYNRVNTEKDHGCHGGRFDRFNFDKKATDPIIFSWLICSSPLQTADCEVKWSKSHVKKIEKHLDEYKHLFLAIDFPDLSRRKSSNDANDTIDNLHLVNRIMELYFTSPKIRQGLAKQLGWDNYLPIVQDQLQRTKSILVSHISDPASICVDYLFATST